MKVFHGTLEGGISVLSPLSKNGEGKPVVFLTDNYAYSLFYIRDRSVDFVTCGVGADGKVHYEEWFPNQLKTLYSGRSGWVYEADVETEPHRIRGVRISHQEVTISRCYPIKDAYQEIQEEIQKGNIILRTFEEASEAELRKDRDGLVNMLQHGPTITPERQSFFQIYFPECWEKAFG